ncbi:MAG: nucleotidyltransferase [Rubrivivax sp.]|nr:nucleotidyltransferase [Rubrivivax sp.]
MNRDDNLPKAVRSFTAATSARFTYLAEAIARSFEPTPTQLQELERAYTATGEYLIECPELGGLVVQVHAQGSRPMGTIVRPMDATRDGFDIDLVVRLSRVALARYGGPGGPALLLDHLYTALKRYADRHGLRIERWERCITLVYAGGMRADFAPVIDDPVYSLPHGEHHGRIPDRERRNYISTNPRGYCLGFTAAAKVTPVFRLREALAVNFADAARADIEPLPEAAEVFERLLSRYVQLGKVNRNISFSALPASQDLAPTSVFLTSLFAKAYSLLAPQPHDGPLDLLLDVVAVAPSLFQRELLAGGQEQWTLMNPYALGDNLAASMNTAARQQAFTQWHTKFVHDLEALVSAIDGNHGLDTITKAVEQAFGPRASQAVLARNAQRRDGNRALQRAGFIVASTLPVVTPARSHTYFGG